MASMITSKKEQVRDKSVLLFSGGQDSLIMNHLLGPDVLLWSPATSSYGAQESTALEQLIKHGYVDKAKVIELRNVLHLDRWERDDMIVPNRNAHLVLLAANYGETIFLGAVSGDRSYDKDRVFCRQMSELLNHMHQAQHWTEQRDFSVEIPFKGMTKTQMVAQYLKTGGNPHALVISYSCYAGTPRPCGHCKPCFRKWVSLVNNEVRLPDRYLAANPAEAPWLNDLLPLVVKGKYRGAEDADWIEALRRSGRETNATPENN